MSSSTAEKLIADALRKHPRGEEVSRRLVPEQDPDTVAYLTIRLHAPGTISVQGHIGDKRLALQLLEHAKDAIRNQFPDDKEIIVPSRDVDVQPTIPLREMGDMLPHERGDG